MSDSTEQNNDQAPETEPTETEPQEEPQTAEADEAADVEPTEEEAVAPVAAATETERRGKKAEKKFVRHPRRPSGPAPLGEYAIIQTGGKQYRVSVGDRITVERLPAEAGSEITLDRVLFIGGETPQIGTPLVEGATVSATIEEHFRGEKITIFKYKPKKRYRRKMGHRQELTKLAITGISG